MKTPKLPKSRIECPDCTRASGFPLGDAKGFSRRRFLQIGATGIVASYFLDVLNPRVLYGATKASNVYLRNTAQNAIFIFLAVSNVERWRLGGYFWNTLGLEYTLMWTVAAFYFLIHGGGFYSLDHFLIGREF